MLLIVFLGLIANVALVLGDCNFGTPTLHDFDYMRISGPRLWYILKHRNLGTENVFDCVRQSLAFPEGNRSLMTTTAFDKTEQVDRTYTGYITNWNSTGYLEISSSMPMWNGIARAIAVDYERYAIGMLCSEETHELSVYVAYRSPHPDQQTVNDVNREIQDKGVDTSQLVDWPADHCPQSESSAAPGSSA